MKELKINKNDNEFAYGKTVAAKACDLQCSPDNIQELIKFYKLSKLKSITRDELEKEYFCGSVIKQIMSTTNSAFATMEIVLNSWHANQLRDNGSTATFAIREGLDFKCNHTKTIIQIWRHLMNQFKYPILLEITH
jgi:hypothetical protein